MLRIFMPVKIQRLRPGLNQQTWVPEVSMLTTRPPKPSRYIIAFLVIIYLFLRSDFYLSAPVSMLAFWVCFIRFSSLR